MGDEDKFNVVFDQEVSASGDISVQVPPAPYYDYSQLILPDPMSIEDKLAMANDNLFSCQESLGQDEIERTGLVKIKDKIKIGLVEKLSMILRQKCRFTMIQDPKTKISYFRAKVYIFSEDDLKAFIEKLQ